MPDCRRLRAALTSVAAIGLGLCACADSAAQTRPAATNTSSISAAQSRFRNPIGPQDAPDASLLPTTSPLADSVLNDTPDPFIVWHDGYYYETYTSTPIEIRRSRTLAGLADAPRTVAWPREGDQIPRSSNIYMWAPEIHRFRSNEDGQYHWYLYFSPGSPPNKQMAVAESIEDDPMSRYRFKAYIPFSEPGSKIGSLILLGGGALDATVFQNDDGRIYYLFSAVQPLAPKSRLFIAEMENPWTLKTTPMQISSPDLPWEQGTIAVNEGPQVLRRGGKLHVVYSANSCGSDNYALGRLTVDAKADLLDPATWLNAKYPEPIFVSAPEVGVYGPGHNGFFTSADGSETWIVYHAYQGAVGVREGGGACGGGVRTARAQRVDWDTDDNPVLGTPADPAKDLAAPSGDASLAFQFEDATVESASRASQQKLGDPVTAPEQHLVGFAGLRFAGQPGDYIRFRFADVPAGRYTVHLRVLAGPDCSAIRLSTRQGSSAYAALGTLNSLAKKETPADLDFGTVTLGAGTLDVELAIASTSSRKATGISLDQLRLVAAD